MNPTSDVHCNHIEKGMIFLRIGRGNYQTLSLWGKAMCQLLNPFTCHPPFWIAHLPLSYPTTILNVLLLVGAVIAGEWSVAGLSVLAHRYTPPANRTSRWEARMNTPIIPLSPRQRWALSRTFPLAILHCRPSSCREREVLFLTRGILSVGSHAARRGARFGCHSHFL